MAAHLRCTGCPFHRHFSDRADIPERFKDGCPNCGSPFAVETLRQGGIQR